MELMPPLPWQTTQLIFSSACYQFCSALPDTLYLLFQLFFFILSTFCCFFRLGFFTCLSVFSDFSTFSCDSATQGHKGPISNQPNKSFLLCFAWGSLKHKLQTYLNVLFCFWIKTCTGKILSQLPKFVFCFGLVLFLSLKLFWILGGQYYP